MRTIAVCVWTERKKMVYPTKITVTFYPNHIFVLEWLQQYAYKFIIINVSSNKVTSSCLLRLSQDWVRKQFSRLQFVVFISPGDYSHKCQTSFPRCNERSASERTNAPVVQTLAYAMLRCSPVFNPHRPFYFLFPFFLSFPLALPVLHAALLVAHLAVFCREINVDRDDISRHVPWIRISSPKFAWPRTPLLRNSTMARREE